MSSTQEERQQRKEGAEGLPSVYIGTPHPYHVISSRFCHSLRNMFIPFPDHHWEFVSGRFIPDARNAIIANAIHGGFDYTMMIDADQHFAWDFFLRLYGGIKKYGENTIVTGWANIKSGLFSGKPCVFRFGDTGGGVTPISEVELRTSEGYIEVDSFGTAGFLAPTAVFRKIGDPIFADLNIIREGTRVDGCFAATKFEVGQDLLFGRRAAKAGIKLVCATQAFMPHETISAI